MSCKSQRVNVGTVERVVSALGGMALAYAGYRKGGVAGVALGVAGAGLATRGATGHCPMYKQLHISTTADPVGVTPHDYYKHGVRVEESVTIQQPIGQVFAFWRNFENLARFMRHLKSVTVGADEQSHWVVEGPAGKDIEWDAVVINEEPDRLIAWQSLPGAMVNHTGSVRFKQAAAGRGTEVHVIFEYLPPAGKVGVAIARILGKTPGMEVRSDLRRLRQLLETGEVPTVKGQSSGRGKKLRTKGMLKTAAVAGATRMMGTTDHTSKFARDHGREEDPDAEVADGAAGTTRATATTSQTAHE